VAPLDVFYTAEDYHQDYATLHPDQPYVFFNDLPKIANLRAMFPEVWRESPRLVFAENAS
jgi:peptide-methionine (S)-S-oxide reductase